MIPKQLTDFMQRLIKATANGEVSWKEGAEDAYFAARKDADLHIRYMFDHDTGESGYSFRILRRGADAFFTVTSDEDDFAFMRNLYSGISVNAAGGETIVDDLFD